MDVAAKPTAKAKAKATARGDANGNAGAQAKEDQRKLKVAEDKLLALQKELVAARAAAAATPSGAVAPAAAADTGASTGCGKLDANVGRARGKLKKLREMPDEVHEFVEGGYEQCVVRLQAELDSALAAGAARASANRLSMRAL